MSHLRDPIADAYCCLAEASLTGEVEHGRHACERLAELVPTPREDPTLMATTHIPGGPVAPSTPAPAPPKPRRTRKRKTDA